MRPKVHVHPITGKVKRSPIVRTTRCGKQGYSGRKFAVARAKEAQRLTGEPIEAYHCLNGCHAWHIGHPPKPHEQAS